MDELEGFCEQNRPIYSLRRISSGSDNRSANGVVNARLKDNAGRRGNKREKIKRVPFKFEGSLS